MASERNDLIDRLQYAVLRLIAAAMHCFPIDTNLQTAKLIGTGLYHLDARHRKRALANLRRSFPQIPEVERARLAKRSAQQMIMLFVDILFTTRLIRLETWTKYCRLTNFEPVLRLLMDERRGLILLTGHYGNFELCGYLLALLGFPTSSVARPLDNPYVSRWVFGVRERLGQRIITKRGATTEVIQELDNLRAVAFVADQNAGTKGMFVDFFGRKASTYKSIGLLAMQYEVPVVIGYARRIGEGFRFDVAAQDIIFPEDWKTADDPLFYITQRYTAALEAVVRDDPTQYWWVHRRWKTRPKGEAPEEYD